MKLVNIHNNMVNYYHKMKLANCTYELVDYIVRHTKYIIFPKCTMGIFHHLKYRL